MPIQQVISQDDYVFLEQMRTAILEDRDIIPEDLHKALTLITSGARESRTITNAKAAASKRGAKAEAPSLVDLLSLGSTPI